MYRFSKDWLVHEAMIYFTLYRKRAITAHHLGIRFAGESCSPQRSVRLALSPGRADSAKRDT